MKCSRWQVLQLQHQGHCAAKAFPFERTKRVAMTTSSGRSHACSGQCSLLQDDDNLEDIYNDDELKVELLKELCMYIIFVYII